MMQQTDFGWIPPEQNPQYKKEQRKNLGYIGLGLCIYQVMMLVVSITMTEVCSRLFPTFFESEAFNWLSELPAYIIGLPVLYLFLRVMPKKAPEKRALGGANFVALLGGSLALMMAGNLLSMVLMSVIEEVRNDEISNAVDLMTQGQSPLYLLVFFVIVAPVCEELIFRKWIMDRLLPYSETLAVVTSGLLFGLMHGNFYQFFYATALGMLFGVVYVKTGRLRHTILLHAILNLTGSMTSGFLAQVTAEDAVMTSSINPWILVGGIYSTALYTLMICGVILLIRNRKEGTLCKTGDRFLTLGTQFKLAWSGGGTIAFCVLSGLSFFASLFI